MKKLLILMCFIFSLVFTGCNNSEVESSSYTDEDTKTISTSNYSEDSNDSDNNNLDSDEDSNSEEYDSDLNEDSDKDYSDEDSNSDSEYEDSYNHIKTKDDELGDLADIVASQVPSDFKVTYQYETSNMTGYIFLTWMGASDVSRSELNDIIESSGLKDSMQDLANSTADELDSDVCIVFRDMSNKTLYSCYND